MHDKQFIEKLLLQDIQKCFGLSNVFLLKDLKVKNKFKMKVIKSGILGGKEDWQRVAEIIRSIARMELGETLGKISTAGGRET